MFYRKKWVYQDVGYLRKKHCCPDCNAELIVVKASKILDPYSREVDELDLRMWNESRPKKSGGIVEYHWKEFVCPVCENRFTIRALKKRQGMASSDIEREELFQRKRRQSNIMMVIAGIIMALIAMGRYYMEHGTL